MEAMESYEQAQQMLKAHEMIVHQKNLEIERLKLRIILYSQFSWSACLFDHLSVSRLSTKSDCEIKCWRNTALCSPTSSVVRSIESTVTLRKVQRGIQLVSRDRG